ncbi:hypothetical protein [Bacillus changyiensis]|uniref:hypothetical protein n=1 Tax=Bacillus changyiensis TaxID=3004103 RepID=UPI0022E80ABE|nr:hypothetical protein [Bacillus changyiensis]MDA1478043.1 hypothetical protein [Bacillus changyiensis]
MFDKILELYSKFAIYLVHILIFSIILASFHPQIFQHFFSAVAKFIPESIINYYSEKNINQTDVFYIFTIISAISGIGAIWNFFYPRNYVKKMIDAGLKFNEFPSFHMTSIHNNSSEITILFLLIAILFTQTNVISFSTIKNLEMDLLINAPIIFIFCSIGILAATVDCIMIIMSGFGTIKKKN